MNLQRRAELYPVCEQYADRWPIGAIVAVYGLCRMHDNNDHGHAISMSLNFNGELCIVRGYGSPSRHRSGDVIRVLVSSAIGHSHSFEACEDQLLLICEAGQRVDQPGDYLDMVTHHDIHSLSSGAA